MTNTLLMTAVQAAPSDGSSVGAIVNFLMPMVLIFGIFYILVLRPQNRRVKQHQATIAAVKKGDEVITGGGIRGRVTKVTDEDAEVEIANGVRVRVIKSTLTHVLTGSAKPAND
jgi:preprotein translocase subunit YajC